MRKHVKIMYLILIAITVYFTFSFVYNKYINNKGFVEVYALKTDISKGDKVNSNNLYKLKIKSDKNIYIKDISNLVFNDWYKRDNILLNTMTVSETEYIDIYDDKEVINIEIDKSNDFLDLTSPSKINIYFSTKKITDILNSYNMILSSEDDGYMTALVCENIKIIEVEKEDNKIKSILIEVEKEKALILNNLKNYGVFSITLVK